VKSQCLQTERSCWKTAVAESAQSLKVRYLEVLRNCRKECVQEFSPRDLGIFQSSSRGLVLEALEGGAVKVFCRRTSSVREHFVHFAEITKEEIDGRSSPWRIHEVPEAVRSCRGARRLRKHSSSVKLGRNRSLDHSRNRVSGIRELKGRSLCIKTREVARCEVPR
jgi:hypothetical protein